MDVLKQSSWSEPKQSPSRLLQGSAPPINRSDEVIAMSALSSIGKVAVSKLNEEEKNMMVKTYKLNIQDNGEDKNTISLVKSESAGEETQRETRRTRPPPSYPHQVTTPNILYVYDGSKKLQNFGRIEKPASTSSTSSASSQENQSQKERIKIMNSKGEIFEMNTVFPVSVKSVSPQSGSSSTGASNSTISQSESQTHIANQMIVTGRPISPVRDVYKCEECEYTSHNKHYLKQHVDLVHNSDRPFKCRFCDYAGKRSHSLKEHMIVHSNERPYVCCHCNATFRKKGHLTNHEKLHQKTVNCPVCQVSMPSAVIEAHMRDLHKSKFQKLFVCEVCSFIAIDSASINKHLETHKKTVQNKQQIFVCSSCQTKCPDFDSFLKHAESHRDGAESKVKGPESLPTNENNSATENKVLIKCTECGFVASDQETMKSHMWKHIDPAHKDQEVKQTTVKTKGDNSQDKKEKSVYRCVDCEFVCDEAYKFVIHMLSHRPELQSSKNSTESSNTPKSIQKGEENVQKTTSIEKKSQTSRETTQGGEATTEKSILLVDATSQKLGKEIERPSVGTATKVMIVKTDETRRVKADSTGQSSNGSDPKIIVQQKTPVQKILVRHPTQEGKPSMEIPAFVRDSQTARFRCTICGYTCEYQRTIKAHIWKHSGNKDIDYPMFQNGPLSIYDEAPYVKEEIVSQAGMNMMPNTAVKVQIEKYLADKQAAVTKPNVEIEKPKDIQPAKQKTQQPSAISPVAPVLASLLALRAKQKAAENTCPETDATDNSNATGDNKENKATQELKQPLKSELAVLNITDVSLTKMDPLCASGVDSNKEGDESKKISTKSKSLLSKAESSTTSNECAKEKTELLKRKSDERSTDDDEMHPATKRFCTSGASVVVESVASLPTLSTFTGIGSESVCGTEADRNVRLNNTLSDSGIASCSSALSSQSNTSADQSCVPLPVLSVGDGAVHLSINKAKTCSKSVSEKEKESDMVQYVLYGNSEDESKDSSDDDDSSDENRLEIDEPRTKLPRQRTTSASTTESAVTLLSLLQKGPNNNPACPVLPSEQVNANETSIPEDIDEVKSDDSSLKKGGISSSLLAVIEQLRERSRESESQEGDETTIPRKAAKRKIKRESADETVSLESMGNVEKLEEDKEVKYRCKLCHYSNSSTFIIRQHMRLHKEKKPFECSLCEFIATSSEDLQDHMIKHCKVRTYQCKLCTSAFNYKSQLRAHMRAHNDKDVFVCDDCDFESNNPVTFRNHVRGHTEKKLYKCEVCEKRFMSKHDLKSHKKGLCGKQKSLNCLTCDFVAIGPQEQRSHAKVHNKEFKCAKCDYVTTSITRFQNHARIHEEPKALKCELCDFPAVSSRSLKSHMKRHINDQRFVQQPLEQYKCNLCGYVCHHLPSLKSHMWRHASDTNYSYEFTNEVINAAIDYDCRLDTRECQSSDVLEFYQTIRQKLKERLSKQEGKEDNERANQAVCWVTFRCCQCGFETINKAELNMHMKSHSDVIQWTLQVSQSEKTKS